MRTVILASMRTYARRYVAALVAVIIATGFIVAINSLSAAAREGSGQAVAMQYRGADVAAADINEPGQAAALKRIADSSPDITASASNWQAWSDVTLPDGPKTASLGSIASDKTLRWQQFSSGRLPVGGDQIAMSKDKAKDHGVAIGDSVSVDVGGKSRRFAVTGLVDDVVGPLTSTLYLPEASFADLRSISMPIDMVFAVDQGTSAEVIKQLQKAVPDAAITSGADHQRTLRLQATQGIDIFQKLILVFAGISLFVGALVIANTFTILLAQRARDLALLRCVGAERRQIAQSVLAEGFLIGVLGSMIGVAAGYLVARIVEAAADNLSPATPIATPGLGLGAVVVPVVLGIAVTVAASYLPARRAGVQSPLAALQPQGQVELRTKAGAVRLAAAALFLFIGSAGLFVGLQGSLAVGMLGGMLTFIGVLLVTPVLIPAAIRIVGPLARRGGVPGRLAYSNSMRNPRRTAATSTALLIGVTLITSVVVGTASISDKVNTSLDSNHPVDLVVSAPKGALPDGLDKRLDAVHGVAKAVTVPGATARLGKGDVTVLGVDDAALGLIHGNQWLRDLGPNEIVIPAGSAAFPDVLAGDDVVLQVGGQLRELTVSFGAGIGDNALVSRSALTDMGAKTTPQAVWIRAASKADAADVTSDVMAITETSDLDLTGGLPERAEILKQLDVVLAVTVALLAIAVLIALIGVGNTLSLSVLERVRENSLLRALGLERKGLRTMLAVEALLMAGVSAVLGILLGGTYAWFGVKTMPGEVFANSAELVVPWSQIGLIFVVAAAAGLLACVLPARQAARIAPAAGLVAD